MKVLGFDPGLYTGSFAVLQIEGERLTPLYHGICEEQIPKPEARALRDPSLSSLDRIVRVMEIMVPWFRRIIQEFAPDQIAVESSAFQTRGGSNSVQQIAEIRGVMHWEAHQMGIPWEELYPASVRKLLLGKEVKRGDKAPIAQYMSALLELPELRLPRNNHIADAYSLSLAWWRRSEAVGEARIRSCQTLETTLKK